MPGQLVCPDDAERIAYLWNNNIAITRDAMPYQRLSRLHFNRALTAIPIIKRGIQVRTEYIITERLFSSLVRRGLVEKKERVENEYC
jgi:hypothetical protein